MSQQRRGLSARRARGHLSGHGAGGPDRRAVAALEPLQPVGRAPGHPPKWKKRQLIDEIRWGCRRVRGWANYCVSREHTRWVRAVTLLNRFPSGAAQPGSAAAGAGERRGQDCPKQRTNHLHNRGHHLARSSNRSFPAASTTASAAASRVAGIGRIGGLRAQTMRKPTGMNDSTSRKRYSRPRPRWAGKVRYGPESKGSAGGSTAPGPDVIDGIAGGTDLRKADLALPRTAPVDLVAERNLPRAPGARGIGRDVFGQPGPAADVDAEAAALQDQVHAVPPLRLEDPAEDERRVTVGVRPGRRSQTSRSAWSCWMAKSVCQESLASIMMGACCSDCGWAPAPIWMMPDVRERQPGRRPGVRA